MNGCVTRTISTATGVNGRLSIVTDPSAAFPMLDEDLLLSLPKANKAQDLERMYTSPNSEDWVTWNMLRALQRKNDGEWWAAVVAAAEADAGRSGRWTSLDSVPTVELWRSVPTPPAYEKASRQRMASSDNSEWMERTSNPRAVEGSTEVDLVFDGTDYLVFVEAKLHSDVSPSTTYDPDRNQIVRNIDCLIEQAGDREPFFWMLVKDRAPYRAYSQLLAAYRSDPQLALNLLPHRDPDELRAVINSVAVITWEELFTSVPTDLIDEDILSELLRRSSTGSQPQPAADRGVAERAIDVHSALPGADWHLVEEGIHTSEMIANAVRTIPLDEMGHVPLGKIVPAIYRFGDEAIDGARAPSVIQWRLLPQLPATWRGLAGTTIG